MNPAESVFLGPSPSGPWPNPSMEDTYSGGDGVRLFVECYKDASQWSLRVVVPETVKNAHPLNHLKVGIPNGGVFYL